MEPRDRERLIQQHLEAIRVLQADAATRDPHEQWPPKQYYLLWHVLIGAMLGFIGSGVSLLFNVIGAPMAGKHPLELIRVYLTFPMGESALTATNGELLTVGCILYLITGGLYGIAFHLITSTQLVNASRLTRWIVGSAMGLALWVINFYGILSWLQPLMLGGNWIVELVPPWVAAATHLVFAWTMLLAETWGRFEPFRTR